MKKTKGMRLPVVLSVLGLVLIAISVAGPALLATTTAPITWKGICAPGYAGPLALTESYQTLQEITYDTTGYSKGKLYALVRVNDFHENIDVRIYDSTNSVELYHTILGPRDTYGHRTLTYDMQGATGSVTLQYQTKVKPGGIRPPRMDMWDQSWFKGKVYPEETPAGDFYINDTKVTTSTTLVLATRDLTLEFIATEGASYITSVRIVVDGHLDETKTSTTGISSYQETWTAPSDGTYTINCYFTAGGQTVAVASLIVGVNVEVPAEPWQPSVLTYLGLAFVVAGVSLGAHRRWGLL